MALMEIFRETQMALLAGLTIILVLFSAFQLSKRSKQRPAGCQLPKTNPESAKLLGLPLILKVIRASRLNHVPKILCSVFDDTDPEVHTIAQSILGKQRYWTRDPDNIKHILSSAFGDWKLPDARTSTFLQCWGGGIFGADGHQWKHSRAMARPAFKTGLIHDTQLLERHVQNLFNRIPTGEVIDLGELFPLFTMDVATELLFNESTGCLDPVKSEEGQLFASHFNYIMRQMSMHLTAPFTQYLHNPKLRKATRFIFAFTDDFIYRALEAQRTETSKGRASFINKLASIDDSPSQLRSELLSIIVAGRDTTAALLGVLWWHLSRREDILQKLRAEIAHLRGQPPSVKDLKGFKYLENVINEVLRLYPINPINSRTARCDNILPRGGGPDGLSRVFVEQGQTVIFSSLALHRRKDIWGDDALELRPERWDSVKPTVWEYIPFGGGPRICLGQHLALLETGYTTVRLLQEFPLVAPHGSDDFVEKFAMALTSGEGCKMKLSR